MADLLILVIVAGAFAVFVWWLWRDDPATAPSPKSQVVTPVPERERVLFLCTHNSARSQMAEALLREMAGDRFRVASAGTTPTTVHPLAIAVMANRGLDLRSHRSKSSAQVGPFWEYVITLCDQAFEECPDYPTKTTRLHWSIEDPSRPRETPDLQLDAFCRVRDDLALRLRRWVAEREERP